MKNKNLISLILLVSISFISAYATAADKIRWIAQNSSPYSYTDQDGNNVGLAIDVAKLLIKQMNLDSDSKNIEVVDLTKFFVLRNNDTNTVFFPLVKTPQRADRFKWVGPIASVKPVLIAKKQNNIKVKKLSDLNKYSIGDVNGFYAVDKLKKLGVNSSAFKSVENDIDSLKELNDNKIDVVLCDELSCNFSIKSLNLNASDFEVVYRLNSEKESYSFAFSKDTKDEVISRVSKAFKEIKTSKNGKTSEYDKIINKYKKEY